MHEAPRCSSSLFTQAKQKHPNQMNTFISSLSLVAQYSQVWYKLNKTRAVGFHPSWPGFTQCSLGRLGRFWPNSAFYFSSLYYIAKHWVLKFLSPLGLWSQAISRHGVKWNPMKAFSYVMARRLASMSHCASSGFWEQPSWTTESPRFLFLVLMLLTNQ